jgi:hypothetical protein
VVFPIDIRRSYPTRASVALATWPFALAMANELIAKVEAGLAEERHFREKLVRARTEVQDKGQRGGHLARANILRIKGIGTTAAKQTRSRWSSRRPGTPGSGRHPHRRASGARRSLRGLSMNLPTSSAF